MADMVAPSVVSRVPTVGASGVSVASPVSVTFDEAIVAGYAVSVTPQGGSAVAGATAWDAGSRTLTFTPSAALAVSTQYAVSVSGVADAAGNAAAPLSWSFTTAGSAVPEATIFGSLTPAVASASDTAALELGTRFTVATAGVVTGVRFYKGSGNTGVHVGRLWDGSGALLAAVTFSGESGSGWQTAHFSSPVAVVAGRRTRSAITPRTVGTR